MSLTLTRPERRTSPAAPAAPPDPPPPGRARWERPALAALLLATAVLYLVGLTASGYANEFYAAAVQAGTRSGTAWLFGSLDSASSITVDKPPASLWLMVLSARLLGFSSFSLLLPQALLGVATVGATVAAVRRWAGAGAGLVAGALVAVTPVAALMFRFDNPDALLTFLLTLAAYLVVRAVDATRASGPVGARRALRWLVLAGLTIGFAFLTKMFQGLLVLPAFALAYLVAARLDLRRRVLHLVAALGGVVVGAGWFVLLVQLWPSDLRPYIGGSTNNSLWELAIGYNGLGRILGGSGNGGGGGGSGQNTGFGGSTGLGRLFNDAFGTEISWFLPAALLGLVAVLVLVRRAPHTDRTRAGLVLWGGSLVVSALVLSFMEGTVHAYYAVALAPSVAATVAVAGAALWRRRTAALPRLVLTAMVALTAVWSWWLLQDRAASWLPGLRYGVLVAGVGGAVVFAVTAGSRRLRRLAAVALVVGALGAGAGSAGWTVATAASAHSGSIPTSGPSGVGTSAGGTGGAGGLAGTGGPGGARPSRSGVPSGTAPSGSAGTSQSSSSGTSTSSASVASLLRSTTSTWSAATVGSQSAASLELSSGTAVMAIGGWDGSDPSITLAGFQADVSAGRIAYFVVGGQGGGGQGGSSTVASQITAWVAAHYTATTVGGSTVYDLTTTSS